MMDKRFLESFLRLNNVSGGASPAEIQTVLLSAHWSPEEIEEALTVHGSDSGALKAFAQKKHEQVFRPDMDWSSSKLSSLLGVDVIIDPQSFRASLSKEARRVDTSKKMLIGFSVAVLIIAVAAGLGIALLYFFEIGPFNKNMADLM